MEVISIVKIIEEIEVAGHPAECIVIDGNTLSGFDNSEVDLTGCNAFDRAPRGAPKEQGTCDSARCTAHLNEALRVPIDLFSAGAVAVYLLDDGIPISAGSCKQSCKFIGECGITKCKVRWHY